MAKNNTHCEWYRYNERIKYVITSDCNMHDFNYSTIFYVTLDNQFHSWAHREIRHKPFKIRVIENPDVVVEYQNMSDWFQDITQ